MLRNLPFALRSQLAYGKKYVALFLLHLVSFEHGEAEGYFRPRIAHRVQFGKILLAKHLLDDNFRQG